jgi:hypothetical protein
METARLKVVTITAAAELQERVEKDLWGLGVREMSVGKVDAIAGHGHRRASFLDSGNLRIEMLVDATIASKILERIVKSYDGQDITAYAADVEAVPKAHFT